MTNERATELAKEALEMFKQRLTMLDMYDQVITHTAYALERAADEGAKPIEPATEDQALSFGWMCGS